APRSPVQPLEPGGERRGRVNCSRGNGIELGQKLAGGLLWGWVGCEQGQNSSLVKKSTKCYTWVGRIKIQRAAWGAAPANVHRSGGGVSPRPRFFFHRGFRAWPAATFSSSRVRRTRPTVSSAPCTSRWRDRKSTR